MELWLRNNIRIDISTQEATLKESIDMIAYTLSVTIAETEDIKSLELKKNDRIALYDYAYGTGAYWMLFDGVIWDISINKKTRKISITGKERTIYMEESEDEYMWSNGQTASQRVSVIANDWGIPIGIIDDTQIGLAKDFRKESLYSSIKKDLKETAQKGGSLYRVRMDEKLELFEVGSNILVYEMSPVIDELEYNQSLTGMVTQIKVLGKNEKEDTKSPIIGVFKKDTETYGTIQKILQDEKVDDYSKAKSKSDSMFSTGEDSIKINCTQDINTLRAGNKISLYGNIYYITDMIHRFGGRGSMNLVLMSWEGVKAKFYGE